MTVVALFLLEHEGTSTLECGASAQILWRNRLATPGVHYMAPGCSLREMGKRTQRYCDEQNRHHSNWPAFPTLFPFTGDEGKSEQHNQTDCRANQQYRCLR